MNILYITANPQEAEFGKTRLASLLSDLHLDVALSVKDAAGFLGDKGAYD
ncbi:MAG: hypothetical protein H6Q04_244, partial [Acidobacteria bacterium]|nr:hypothetical protein [Acidobacteriota bacterium]